MVSKSLRLSTTNESQKNTVRLIANAKLNLGLRVLSKRPDGFHELRTLFQTISLADWIDLSYRPSRVREVTLEANLDIPHNLIVRAAHALLDEVGIAGRIHAKLTKRIPMGGGLGGGSANAAAMLLGLPALMKRRVPLTVLSRIGAALGSDIPFFLHGGRAIGLGRGTELYPLPDGPSEAVLLVTPGFPIATPEAYRKISANLGAESASTAAFEAQVWQGEGRGFYGDKRGSLVNDFEPSAFEQFPQLAAIQKRLWATGASPAGMTGSGSTMYGIYGSKQDAESAAAKLQPWKTVVVHTVMRRRFRAMWFKQLGKFSDGVSWPPAV